MGDIEEKQRKFALNARSQGGIGEILLPSASVSFHQLPPTAAACGGFVIVGFNFAAVLVVLLGGRRGAENY